MGYRKGTLLEVDRTKALDYEQPPQRRQIVLRIGRRSSKTYTAAQEILNLWLSL